LLQTLKPAESPAVACAFFDENCTVKLTPEGRLSVGWTLTVFAVFLFTGTP
jgi:hypothetical protein